MLETILYFIASYSCVLVVASLISVLGTWLTARKITKTQKYSLAKWWAAVYLSLLALLLILPLLPYLLVEHQTTRYRRILLPTTVHSLKELGLSDHILFFKILSAHHNRALLYVVIPCTPIGRSRTDECCGITIRLHKSSLGWEFRDEWDAVWSDCGSADGNVFPPYPHN